MEESWRCDPPVGFCRLENGTFITCVEKQQGCVLARGHEIGRTR